MASYYLCPLNWQQISAAGAPVSGGFIYTYQAGTSTPVATYTDNTGATPQANPIQLNTRGVPSSPIWMLGGQAVKFVIQDASNVTLQTFDNVLGINDQNAIASSTGSSLVGFLQSGTGAVARTAQDKMREVVSVKDFGAVGDGATDDSAKFVAAANSLGPKGGVVRYFDQHLIDANITLPKNVILQGPLAFNGSPGTNASQPFGSMAALILNSAATITLGSGAAVTNSLIFRKGMTFPAADSSLFAGTALTVAGDDAGCDRCIVLGFNKAFYSSGYQRPRVTNLLFDCVNGVEITNCSDIPHIKDCHGWPFATIAANGAHGTLERAGSAFYIHDNVDWAKVTDCFSYGYARGFKIFNANSTTLLGCGADDTTSGGAPQNTNSIGFDIEGTSTDTRLIAPQSAAHGTAGIYVNTVAGVATQIVGGDVWGNGTHAVLIDGGDVHISGSTTIRDTGNGVSVTNAASRVFVDRDTRFERVTNPLNPSVSSSLIDCPYADFATLAAGNAPANGNMVVPSLASATPLNLPVTGEIFNVTGTTSFGTLNGGHAGRRVIFIFSGVVSVFSSTGATSAIRLSGNATFTSAANNTLTLQHNGVQWYEIARTV